MFSLGTIRRLNAAGTIKGMAKKKQLKVGLHSKQIAHRIQDVRQVIRDRMKELDNMTAYRLAKLSGVTVQTVSNFIGQETKSIRSDMLEMILAALKLEIRPVD